MKLCTVKYVKIEVVDGSDLEESIEDAVKISEKLGFQVYLIFNGIWLGIHKDTSICDKIEEYEQVK